MDLRSCTEESKGGRGRGMVPVHVCKALEWRPGLGQQEEEEDPTQSSWRNHSASSSSSGLSCREVHNAVSILAAKILSWMTHQHIESTTTTTTAQVHKTKEKRRMMCVLLCKCSLEGALLSLAALDAGVTLVPLSWRWTKRECLEAIKAVVPPEASFTVLCDPRCAALARSVAASSSNHVAMRLGKCSGAFECAAVESTGDDGVVVRLLCRWLSSPRDLEPPREVDYRTDAPLHLLFPAGGGPAAILFTSGTTSRAPKGCGHSHAAFLSQASSKALRVGYRRGDRHLHCAPLHHVSGLCALVTAMASRASSHLFIPEFSGENFAAALESVESAEAAGNVCVLAVPAMLSQLSDQVAASASGRAKRGYPSVRRTLLGGDQVGAGAEAACARLFPRSDVFATYGMTEACSSITIRALGERPPPFPTEEEREMGGRGQYAGTPLLHIEVKVDARESGGVGEVLLRGASVTERRAGAPQQDQSPQKRPWESLGWLRTGDLGRLDGAGGLYLCGRISDAIRTGGEMVYPSEVEGEISSCEDPKVAECVVVGLPDRVLGQRACAVVVLAGNDGGSGGGGLTALKGGPRGRIASHLRRARGLAGFRVPRVWLLSAEPLPRGGTGKVDRRAVRAMAQASAAGGGRANRSKL